MARCLQAGQVSSPTAKSRSKGRPRRPSRPGAPLTLAPRFDLRLPGASDGADLQ